LGSDLRRALERTTASSSGPPSSDELVLWYQPLVRIATGKLVGVEALARWQHPTRGLLGPNTFIGLAEDDGLIRPLGLWVLSTALHQLAEWREPGSAMFGAEMSVNVSARQLPDPDLVAQIAEMLARLGLRADLLHVELTESMLAHRDVLARLTALRNLGVKLSIDDFGTGYSSLAYLRHLPADELKIDRTFVRNLATDRRDRALIKSVLTMAHDLGLTVVAEGVETTEQLEVLRDLECDIAQGYLFARPSTPAELDRIVHTLPAENVPANDS
jgi:diguanylate cyclase